MLGAPNHLQVRSRGGRKDFKRVEKALSLSVAVVHSTFLSILLFHCSVLPMRFGVREKRREGGCF